MAIDFILAEASERHAPAIAHGGRIELRIRPQRTFRTKEKLTTGILRRVSAFHQTDARAVNAVFIVAVVERDLVSNGSDLQCGRDQKRSRQRDLPDHQRPGDDVDQPTAVAAATLSNDFSCICMRAE